MKFRKKPVVIDAVQFDGTPETAIAIRQWINAGLPGEAQSRAGHNSTYDTMYIDTLEGTLIASEGDWIIKGVKGEFYPCKPDVFKTTYEEV